MDLQTDGAGFIDRQTNKITHTIDMHRDYQTLKMLWQGINDD